MAASVQTILDERIAKYINRVKEQSHATEAAVVRELVEGGYDEVVRQLHARYQRANSLSARLPLDWVYPCVSCMTSSSRRGCQRSVVSLCIVRNKFYGNLVDRTRWEKGGGI